MAITVETLNKTHKEAVRFLRKLADARDRLTTAGYSEYPLSGCKETGAVRRASMDLTRALAVLRGKDTTPDLTLTEGIHPEPSDKEVR